tara:strand:- start:533 stop:949 length:417 start_codon:yes stop_codon:yes gene_type:complete
MSYTPEFPYTGEHIVVNSGRVFINARDDSAFINANKAVSLGSGGTLNFDSKDKCIINSSRIDLGLAADHPVTRGDILKRILEKIVNELAKAGGQLETSVDGHGAPIVASNRAGTVFKRISKKIDTELNDMNSETTFTL